MYILYRKTMKSLVLENGTKAYIKAGFRNRLQRVRVWVVLFIKGCQKHLSVCFLSCFLWLVHFIVWVCELVENNCLCYKVLNYMYFTAMYDQSNLKR